MKPTPIRRDQTSLFSSFEDQLSHNNALYKLKESDVYKLYDYGLHMNTQVVPEIRRFSTQRAVKAQRYKISKSRWHRL